MFVGVVVDQGFVADGELDAVERGDGEGGADAAGGAVGALDLGGQRGGAGDEGAFDGAVAVFEVVVEKAGEAKRDVVRAVAADIEAELGDRADAGDQAFDVVLVLDALGEEGGAILDIAVQLDGAVAEGRLRPDAEETEVEAMAGCEAGAVEEAVRGGVGLDLVDAAPIARCRLSLA